MNGRIVGGAAALGCVLCLGVYLWMTPQSAQDTQTSHGDQAPSVPMVSPVASIPALQNDELDVLIPNGPEHREAIAGEPDIQRWRLVTLGVNRQTPPSVGSVLRFAPFDDHAWRCRVRSVRPVNNGIAINADALDESGALLMVELRADAVVVRFDRRSNPSMIVGTMPQMGLVATEWQAAATATTTPTTEPAVHSHAPGCDCAAHRAAVDAQGNPLTGQVGGPGFIAEKLPNVPLRREVLDLSPAARARAEQALTDNPRPAQDLMSLHVNKSGALLYACRMKLLVTDEPRAKATSSSTAAITFAAALSVPLYHSRSSQTTRIGFLDFDGFRMPANTDWEDWDNSGVTYAGKDCKAYDTDGNAASFSNKELAEINLIWQQVSEIYAPFDIDITTEQPVAWTNYTAHILITDELATDGTHLPHYNYGGIAYLNTYGNFFENYNSAVVRQPAFVSSLEPTSYIGQSAAHEFGHQLNLSHDGTVAHDSISAEEYYDGHMSGSYRWGPVMGGGRIFNVCQWSKGGYLFASNTQDDLAIISSSLPYVADDHGGTIGTATAITPSGTSVNASGCISQTDEVDMFRIVGGAGTWSITCTPSLLPLTKISSDLTGTYNLPSLNVLLRLYNSSGTQIAATTAGTAMSSTLSATVTTTGTYYLTVVPTGVGSPLSSSPSGFTSYGSLGTYSWSGTVPPVATCTITLSSVATIGSGITATWTFSQSVSGFTVDDIVLSGSASATISNFSGTGTTYTATITPTDSGSLVVSLPADAVSGGNASALAATSVRPNCTMSAPTPVIQGTAFTADIAFTSPVTGFAKTDITVSGGTVNSVSGSSGSTFTASILPTSTGTITLNMAAGVVTDSETGVTNAAATAATTTASPAPNPTCTITVPASVTVGIGFFVDFTFSAPVSGFTITDISPTNGALLSDFSGSGAVYHVAVVPMTVGTVAVSIPGGAATGAYSNVTDAAASSTVTVNPVSSAPPASGGGGGSGCGLGSGVALAGLLALAGWFCLRRRDGRGGSAGRGD